MNMSVTTLLTEDEFLNLPDSPGRQEFRDGVLIELPPAQRNHSALVKRNERLLETVLHESRVWSEVGFQLRPNRWVVPDVCVIWPDQRLENGYYQRSPMVAIEIASRGNTAEELQQKVDDYLDYGIGEAVVVYPKSHTMVVYRPGNTLRIGPQQDYHCELIGVTFTPEYRTEIE
jgi:Uma2 family endonuclease